MRFQIFSGTWYLVKADSTSLCGIDPYALARSSHCTAKSPLLSRTSLINWIITLVCSIHPGTPGTPSVCTDVSRKLFFRRKPMRQTILTKVLHVKLE